MARSLRSKRRKKNKIAMRARLKPKYDAQLAAIVGTMKEQTEDLMDTVGDVDFSKDIKIIDPNNTTEENTAEGVDMDTEDKQLDKNDDKIKIPRIDIKKVVKFMSQRKLRTYQAKEKTKKKQQLKGGQKKKPKALKW